MGRRNIPEKVRRKDSWRGTSKWQRAKTTHFITVARQTAIDYKKQQPTR